MFLFNGVSVCFSLHIQANVSWNMKHFVNVSCSTTVIFPPRLFPRSNTGPLCRTSQPYRMIQRCPLEGQRQESSSEPQDAQSKANKVSTVPQFFRTSTRPITGFADTGWYFILQYMTFSIRVVLSCMNVCVMCMFYLEPAAQQQWQQDRHERGAPRCPLLWSCEDLGTWIHKRPQHEAHHRPCLTIKWP